MNKKGFTLIELLAVIVILAIIAIISVPIITDLINKSRYGAFGVTKKNIERAAELYHAKNADDLVWNGDISYVTIGTLKSKKFLKNNLVNTLDSTSINDDTKVLLYRKGRKVDYSLQLYDNQFFDWYQKEMVRASKREDITLPTTVGETVTIDLETLMGKGLVDELRLPLEPENRCVGYVEIEKTTDNYEYNAYVDCLQGASTFSSHYVSYGGKYLDVFNEVKQTSDGGYIAVGESNSEIITKYGNVGKGKYDAIIVKFSSDGTVKWSQTFGGSSSDYFYSVIEDTDGFIAVGSTSSNDGDIDSFNGGDTDALIVKFDINGNVLYKRTYGGSGLDGVEAFRAIVKDGNNYVITGSVNARVKDGDISGITHPGYASLGIVIKFDNQFNLIWRQLFGGSYFENLYSLKKTTDGGYIIVGNSSSNNYDMEGIGWTEVRNTTAIILKYDSLGNLQYKSSFRGSNTDVFYDVIEVNDGYIAVGNSRSVDGDMLNLSKANNAIEDAIIVKYDKTLSNILWKNSYCGSDVEMFNKIIKNNDDEVMVVGYSKSEDIDMKDVVISKGGYKNAIILKYNSSNGNIITSKIFGGNNSDSFNSIIKNSNGNFVVVGSTHSSDIYLRNFNKGHSDAMLVSYDNNMNLIKTFQEPVIIIDKLKDIIPSYGTSLKNKYDNIYTSNNPTIDFENWCSNYNPTYENNLSNYIYGECLKSFNDDDIKVLNNNETGNQYKLIYLGENEYIIDNKPDNYYNWYKFVMQFANTGSIEISNFKLKFADGYVSGINDAVTNGYIEPLVVVSNRIIDFSVIQFPNPTNIFYADRSIGVGYAPTLNLLLKPKKSRLVSVFFTSDKNASTKNGLGIYELRNFDMSITKTK